MFSPVQYVDVSASTGAVLTETDAVRVGSLFDEIGLVTDELWELRKQQYLNRESVFEVSVEDAVGSVGGASLPEGTLDTIEQMSNAQWEQVYEHTLTDTLPDDRPDGMTEWECAAEYRQDKNRPDEYSLVFSGDIVETPEENLVEFPLPTGETLAVRTDSSLALFFDESVYVYLSIPPQKKRVTMRQLAAVDTPPVEVTVSPKVDQMRREYTTKDPVESDIETGHAISLEACSDPFESNDEMEVVCDVLGTGYYTRETKLRWLYLLADWRESILIPYGYTGSPHLLDHLIDLFDLHVAQVPQIGRIVVSRSPIDEFEYLKEEFPEKQNFTDEETQQLCQMVGWPQQEAAFVIDDKTNGTETLEMLARMYDRNVVNEEEVFAYKFVEWRPCPDENRVFEAIKEGWEAIKVLEEFDDEYDVELGSVVIESVREKQRLTW